MYQCSVNSYTTETEADCNLVQGVWFNWYFSYNDVGSTLVDFFDISTMENWPDQRDQANDIVGVDIGPKRLYSPYHAYYYNVFMLIGTYCFLNLLMGVLSLKFTKAADEEESRDQLNPKQKQWVEMMKMIVSATPDLETTIIHASPFRRRVYEVVTGIDEQWRPEKQKLTVFDIVMMAVILLNIAHMCMNSETSTDMYNYVLQIGNYAFTAVFVGEAVLKLISFGYAYFRDPWNKLEFFIVCSNVLDVFVSLLFASAITITTILQFIRLFRLARLYHIIKQFKGLATLIQTIYLSLPAIMNVTVLFLLLYFIFAILANYMFADLTQGIIIDNYTNFQTFGHAMLNLIRASTGEDWNYIMFDCGHTPPNCVAGQTCGSYYNQVFFLLFMTIQAFIMQSLIVVITCREFDKYYLSDDNILQQFKENLRYFKVTWTHLTRTKD